MKPIICYQQGTPMAKLAVIDDYVSFSFTRSFSGLGTWQLVLNRNSLNAERAEGMNFIFVEEGVAGLVKKVEQNTNEDNNIVIYTGVELKGLAYNRIVIPNNTSHLTFNNKTPEYIIAQLLDTQIVSATNTSRRIANTSVAAYTQVQSGITKRYRFTNVGEAIEELATAYGIGWYADIENGAIVFHITHGMDRTKNQSTNDKLVVSYERDGILSSTYSKNRIKPKTALVAGQGEGVDRTLVLLGDSETDIDRHELYIDARDIDDADQLTNRGVEKLAQYSGEDIYHMEFSQSMIERYRTQYNLGDIGTVEDTQIGEEKDFLLSEITEVYEEDLFRLEVVFGFDNTTISALIKRNKEVVEALINNEPIPPTPEAIGALPVGAKAADSDMLDGNHASAFAAANHEHGRITYSGVDNNVVSAQQTSSAYYGSPADWASYIICNHGNGANYYHQMLRLPFGGGLQSQVMTGGTLSGWRTYLDNANFINYVYPVGSIYMSISSTSPATLFGGTWSALPTGRFLRTGTGGATGGSDTHAHGTGNFTLTPNEMPSHNHWQTGAGYNYIDTAAALVGNGGGGQGTQITGAARYTAAQAGTWGTGSRLETTWAGGGAAHNHGNTGSASNVPAYYEVYAWRRTA